MVDCLAFWLVVLVVIRFVPGLVIFTFVVVGLVVFYIV